MLPDLNFPIREIFIREKGKGNALNVGISLAHNDLLCVLDADCILDENALSLAMRHFADDKVVAVGGRLLVMNEDGLLLERIQSYEYMRTFQVTRRVFAGLNAQCLISGAFGIFLKEKLIEVNGYDTDTVGEDMELVLRLQDCGIRRSQNAIVYELKAVCYTGAPHTLKRLMHQRDRWQRGLLDCMIKHFYMIANPLYGFLGLVTIPWQFLPHSPHTTLYVLILTICTTPLPERMGLKSRGGGGMKERVKDTGWMGMDGRMARKAKKSREEK